MNKSHDSLFDELPDGPPGKPVRRWGVFHLRRPTLLEMLVIAGIVGVLIGLLWPAGDHDFRHRFPTPPGKPLGDVAPYAGEYYQGDGLGWNLRLPLRADGVYSFIWSGCCGVYDRDSGYVSYTDGLLTLTPAKPSPRQPLQVFYPVRWGPRVYLIEREDMANFCRKITTGEEPREDARGVLYVGGNVDLGGALPRADGLPELPAKWANYLRDGMLIGTIVEMMNNHRLKIDLSAMHGMQVGDLLAVQGCGRGFSPLHLQVTDVEVQSCVAREVYPGIAGGAHDIVCLNRR
ncbi:MAG: hypothetical protein ACP5XB_32350 [Isosphaeraceae bacterium]